MDKQLFYVLDFLFWALKKVLRFFDHLGVFFRKFDETRKLRNLEGTINFEKSA